MKRLHMICKLDKLSLNLMKFMQITIYEIKQEAMKIFSFLIWTINPSNDTFNWI